MKKQQSKKSVFILMGMHKGREGVVDAKETKKLKNGMVSLKVGEQFIIIHSSLIK